MIQLIKTNNQYSYHIETRQLIRSTNHLTGCYLRGTFVVNGFSKKERLTHAAPTQMIRKMLGPVFTPRNFLDPDLYLVKVLDGSLGISG